MRVIYESVFVDPSRTRCIRSNRRMHVGGQAASNRLQILDNSRASPVDVRAVFRDDENVGIVKHRLGTDGLHVWRGEQGGDDWIGDLVFDDVRRLAFPIRVNNDLYVRNIWQGIERNVPML
jgi:hypothetical protein